MAAATTEPLARPWKRRFDGVLRGPVKTWSGLSNAKKGFPAITYRGGLLVSLAFALIVASGCASPPERSPRPPLELLVPSSDPSTDRMTEASLRYLYQERIFGDQWLQRHLQSIGEHQRTLLELSNSIPTPRSAQSELVIYRPKGSRHLVVASQGPRGTTDILDLNRWFPEHPSLALDLLRPSKRGEALAFSFSPLQGHPEGLFISNGVSTPPQRVLTASIYDARWSPRGAELLVTVKADGGVPDLWRLQRKSDGSGWMAAQIDDGAPSRQFLTIAEATESAAYVINLGREEAKLLRCGWRDSACSVVYRDSSPLVDVIADDASLLLHSHKRVIEIQAPGQSRTRFRAPTGHRIRYVLPYAAQAPTVITESINAHFLWIGGPTDDHYSPVRLTEEAGDLTLLAASNGRFTFRFQGLSGHISSITTVAPHGWAIERMEHRPPLYRVSLRTNDSAHTTSAAALIIEPPQRQHGLVLYVYGAYEQVPALNLRAEWEVLLRRNIAVGVLLSQADGLFSEEGSVYERKERALISLDTLISSLYQEYPLLVIWGRSAGAILATHLAIRRPSRLAGLVLEAPLLSLTSQPADSLPVQEWREWAGTPGSRETLCPLRSLHKGALPASVISVSTADELISLADVATFLASAREKAPAAASVLLFLSDGSTHAGNADRADAALQHARLIGWIEKALSSR